mmetsp:Transcript_39715/g.84685  ORF Transcript_39715/g.84685 Transcript_39715/m.84685 type:complete len:268 (-) Transcript_39715:64-867(-)
MPLYSFLAMLPLPAIVSVFTASGRDDAAATVEGGAFSVLTMQFRLSTPASGAVDVGRHFKHFPFGLSHSPGENSPRCLSSPHPRQYCGNSGSGSAVSLAAVPPAAAAASPAADASSAAANSVASRLRSLLIVAVAAGGAEGAGRGDGGGGPAAMTFSMVRRSALDSAGVSLSRFFGGASSSAAADATTTPPLMTPPDPTAPDDAALSFLVSGASSSRSRSWTTRGVWTRGGGTPLFLGGVLRRKGAWAAALLFDAVAADDGALSILP